MSDPQEELAGIEAAIRDLIPELSERLERHRLGEIEVRRGELRVRVAATSAAPALEPGLTVPPAVVASSHPAAQAHAAGADTTARAAGGHGVSAPAVGYFIYADGLGPGLPVEKGDQLGYVDVLGVRHDVRAPRSGVVRNLVTETGEAVEYGQVLIELEGAAP